MPTTIKVLERIQKLDIEISAIEEEQRKYQSRIEEISASIIGIEGEIETLTSENEVLNGLKSDVEERIRQNSEKVARNEKRVAEIKTPRELKALNKEINSANKAKGLGEEELERLSVKAGEIAAELEKKRAGVDELKAELAGLSTEFEQNKTAWDSETAEKLSNRDEVKAALDPVVLKKYERIRGRLGGVGMVPILNETCQGCYIHVPPQIYVQLKKGVEELINCPHCHRILYVEDPAASEAV